MSETRITCHIRGTRPLLMNAFNSDSDEGASKKGRIYDDLEEAQKRLYLDSTGQVCQPAIHLEACMTKSATDFKFTGRKTYKDVIKSGVFVNPLMIPHKKADWAVDRQNAVVNRARIVRCRPRLDDWELEFVIILRDDRVQHLVVKQIIEDAGKYVGIGDYRPRYGLFEVLKFEAQEAIAS